jgi:glycosyltransferase involved in cell wall biosynthesis
MNVLHINTSDNGGAANSAIRLHMGLLEMGIESHMLFLKRSDNHVPESAYFLFKAKSIFFRLLYKLKLFPTIERRLEKLMNKNRIAGEVYALSNTDFDITMHPFYKKADIINLHWVAKFLDYKSFFKKNTKPVVWTLHDQFAFTGVCHYSGNCTNYTSDCSHCPLIKTNHAQFSLSQKLQSLKTVQNISIVAPSNWLCNISAQSALFSRYNHYHFPYGLDTTIYKPYNSTFVRNVFNIELNKKVVLFVCEDLNNTRKGFSILLEAIGLINNPHVLFYAVGYSGKKIPNVTMLGKVKDERLLALLYNAADVFVLPSLEDNLPNTMLESLACGTPVIAFANGGIPDLVEHGKNGLLATKNTALALKELIKSFLNNEYNFNREAISDEIHSKYALSNQAKNYIKLYQSILLQNK